MRWIAKAKRRLEGVRAGESIAIPTEAVEEELDAIAARGGQAARAVR